MRAAVLLACLLAVLAVSTPVSGHVCNKGKWLYKYPIKHWKEYTWIKDHAKKPFAEIAFIKAMITLKEEWDANHPGLGGCEPVAAKPVGACYKSWVPGKAGRQIKGEYGFTVKVKVVCPFEPFKAWYTIDVLAYTRRDGSYWAPIKKPFAEAAFIKAMFALKEEWDANHPGVGGCEPVAAKPVGACYKSWVPGKAGRQIKGEYGFTVKVKVVCPFEPFKAWYTIDVLAYTRRDGSYWAPIKVLH
ncbi:expressed protein [Chlorella variabilis]|uniref:Expressed protein n=1 Tax=Chlorella variabilis TaxID=554065 RepID=E1Z2Z6_CHLVA|nr:expressed protein [Chlorella variabilis]EFN60080.1 expressed protein [Chlorella variabilis]|eukprot:XP_005852182.1 expressed protein [Chlorella variabilis]